MENGYFIGLDIGTESVGFAVTDTKYNVVKKSGKSLWGMELFEEAKTAVDRRGFRSTSRRSRRRKERVNIVQELLKDELNNVDEGFLKRIKESSYYKEDKSIEQKNSLFNDVGYNDKEFYKKYPTIYHLRKELIESEGKFDFRLYYIAIAHIVKHRGHFLFDVSDTSSLPTFEDGFKSLIEVINTELEKEIDIKNININEVCQVVKSKVSSKEKAKKLESIKGFCEKDKQVKEIINLLCGLSCNFGKLFEESFEDAEISKLSLKNDNYDELITKLESTLEDKFVVIETIKALYDWSVLSEILKEEKYLSFAKVKQYDEHKVQLRELKDFYLNHFPENLGYNRVFKSMEKVNNYSAYASKNTTRADFYKFLKAEIKVIKDNENKKPSPNLEIIDYINKVESLIELDNFLLKQKTTANSIVPYQLNEEELIIILEKASANYNFLLQKDTDGLNIIDKIRATFKYRIPYYVGPLNTYHSDKGGNAWSVRKSNEKVTPWNFEKVIDVKESAERFITKMTNQCTYMKDCNVVPKNSLLYSKFSVLNELNNLKINNENISVELKQKIYNELFSKGKKVTAKALLSYLKSIGILENKDTVEVLSGFDIDFKSTLTSQKDFKEIFKGELIEEEKIENIIKAIVLFGDEKQLLKDKVVEVIGDISEDKLKAILSLKYTGWGRLSKEFLTELEGYSKETGEIYNIIDAMYYTNCNLMELLSYKYTYLDELEKYNYKNLKNNKFTYDNLVKDLYTSPAVKRSIWQALSIVKEIEKINKSEPSKIFIEVARGEEEKKRTKSRKNFLIEKYKAMGKSEEGWLKELESKEDREFQKKKLFLYYTQMGRCMYTNEVIKFEDLFKENIYDIDHIYPRSKVKDDSIINNLVLVKKVYNSDKSDEYPLSTEIQETCKGLWLRLYNSGLIEKEKFNRLTRKEELSVEELSGFIARQLVETRQSTKAVAEVLKRVYPNTEIVYVKAGNVSEFRQKYEFYKVRELNNIHHAKDAYLNIVVGNVYHTKFTSNPVNFFKNNDHKQRTYNLKKMYEFKVERNGNIAWDVSKENNTIETVKKFMVKDDVLFTRMAYEGRGGFFDQTIMPKGKGQHPLKTVNSPLSDISKYGGYNKVAGAYFMLVKHVGKKGEVLKTLEFVPIHLVKKVELDEKYLVEYVENVLELKDAEILIRKIKFNTLLNINGGLFHISGRTNNQIILKPAMQLKVKLETNSYIKKVSRVDFKIKEARKEQKNSKDKHGYFVDEHDKVTIEDNVNTFDIFVDKLRNTSLGKRPTATVLNDLESRREVFLKLSIEEQCEVLMQLLILFECSARASDLTLLGGAKSAGIILINKDLSKFENIKIINQSVTGFYTSEVDISKL